MIAFGELSPTFRSNPGPSFDTNPSSVSKERVFSGVQPTGELHIGNYFGAAVNYVRLQEEYQCIYSVVDYHAITEEYDPQNLSERVLAMAMDLIACGIDPERSILFVQSDIPEHTELCWIFNCFTSYGDLMRMTQFKEKSEQAEFVNAGLFSYPVLQAADILLYRASKVPVGEDQLQHLELARRIARRFNSKIGDFFPEVEPILSDAPRIMSLADPTRKMGKSLGEKHYIGLTEPEESVREKVKTAVTDIGPRQSGDQKSPGVENLFLLLKLSADSKVYRSFEADYQKGTLMYERLKEAVSENLLKKLGPIREKRKKLEQDKEGVRKILQEGARRARKIAQENMKVIREMVGVGRI